MITVLLCSNMLEKRTDNASDTGVAKVYCLQNYYLIKYTKETGSFEYPGK